MAETLTSPAAPAVEEEEFEIELPEDEEVVAADKDVDEPEPEPEPDKKTPEAKKPEPEPEPKKPEPEAKKEPEAKVEPEPEPEAEPESKPTRLDPIAREERNKRKEYARLYAETKERLDAAERRIRLLATQPSDPKDPALKKWQEELFAEASKATDLADVVRISMREMDRRDRHRVQELNAHLYQLQCDLSEMRARSAHADWEKTVREAGMFEAIVTDAQGNFRDPALARRVYYTADGGLAPDPAERMYRLAVGKLEYERSLKGEDEPEPEESKAKGPERKAKAEPKAEPKAEAEAERRGAQRVIEAVSKNSTRPRGIRSLPKAGAGPTRVSKQYLDELLETNPAAYDRLIAKNPELERWHLG